MYQNVEKHVESRAEGYSYFFSGNIFKSVGYIKADLLPVDFHFLFN